MASSSVAPAVLVTGGNKGIGKAICAAALASSLGFTVFVGSRNDQRGQDAVAELAAAGGAAANERIFCVPLDVTSASSIASAVSTVTKLCDEHGAALYGVINNAGGGFGGDESDFPAALKAALALNFTGLVDVSTAFLPLLEATATAAASEPLSTAWASLATDSGVITPRIVNISSAAGPMFVDQCDAAQAGALTMKSNPQWTLDELRAYAANVVASVEAAGSSDAMVEAGLGTSRYGLSKALVNAATIIMARDSSSVAVNACTPGFIETDLTRPYAESQGKTPDEMGMKAPADGTHSAMRLLTAPDLLVAGRYYGSDGLRSPLDVYRGPGDPEYVSDGDDA